MARQTAYVRYKPDADNLTISLVLGGRQRNLNRPTDEPLEKPITRIRANLSRTSATRRRSPTQRRQQQEQPSSSSSRSRSCLLGCSRMLLGQSSLMQQHPMARPGPRQRCCGVMSYNILADQYAGTSYAQQVLFNYCPTKLLDNNYRRQLVLEEVLRYQPDICCLQEVDDKVFAEFLQPHLALAGWAGHFTNKQGRVREGSALFWRTDKWACAAVQDVKLRDVFKLPLAQRHAQFTPMLQRSPDLAEALQKVTTIAQMVLLLPRHSLQTPAAAGSNKAEPNSSSSSSVAAGQPAPLLMINTHLFFHPYAPHIRSLHTAAILEEAAAALADWQQQAQAAAIEPNPSSSSAVEPGMLSALAGLPPPTVLFCGDLNSDLNSGVPGVVEMLQTGRLAADHWDWQMGASFRWGKEEGEYAEESEQQQQQQQQPPEEQQQQLLLADGHDFEPPSSSPRAAVGLHGMDVAVPFVLRSADDLATPYTNYTSGYKALLDYVWYDPSRLHVTRQLPVPAEQLLASFIPSPNFPSDHLAVVYDLAFKPDVTTPVITDPAVAGVPGQQGVGIQQHDSATFTLLPASEDHVSDAVAALARGDVIALPTDTLYGLAAAADSAAAGVLQPGSSSNSGSDTAAAAAGAVVGVRVVPNEFVRGVCRQLGGGIALTSANRSGGESSLCVHDFRELWQYCGAVFDSGRIPVAGNAGSTVLDLTSLAQQQQQGEGAAAVGFKVVRAGVAAESAVELLTKAFGLQQLR
ncbi:hypothetical protein OEZ85_013387 [Tetradesmus obliquus]|uniref:Threonylcarbamoyl-AMP synthase n=1 Tax=Tetradesmus obliquus TaxID=3088 RepID=A0ABY8U7V2_TETOB|nr:hypothetical protein OEZ85_013387 [Tetradesmus obliquus]